MESLRPTIVRLPASTVLTVTTRGFSAVESAISALYGTAYTTKFKVYKPKHKMMTVGHLSAFWPDAHRKPKAQWTGIWQLEVSSFVRAKDLIQKEPEVRIAVVRRPASLVAQVRYVGPYSREGATVKALHAFVARQGYRLAGPHEEVYLSKPGPKAKTIIRYAVVKARR